MTLDTNKINHIIAALDLHIEEAEKATKGPWHIAEGGLGNTLKLDTVYACNDDLNYVAACRDHTCIHEPARNTENAAFIAHARELSPLACQSLKIAIEGLVELAKAYNMEHGQAAISILHSIANRWPSPTE